jgi:hypothetical protein
LEKKLKIQRHLGFKELMPGSSQWEIITDSKHESYLDNQHIMTLFLWTPRIGEIAST